MNKTVHRWIIPKLGIWGYTITAAVFTYAYIHVRNGYNRLEINKEQVARPHKAREDL